MRISKLLPLICAGAFCAAISVRADDNPDQAAARAALTQKMQDLDSQQGQPDTSSNQTPVEVTPSGVAPEIQPAAPAPIEMPPPAPTIPAAPDDSMPSAPTNSVTPSTPPISAEAQNANPTNPPPAMVEMQPKPQLPAPTPLPQTVKKPGFFSRIFNPSNRAKPNSAAVEATQPAPVKLDNSAKNMGFAPIEPPPPPVSPEKEAELHALLQKYEADQITPDQYQAQRAAIINSP